MEQTQYDKNYDVETGVTRKEVVDPETGEVFHLKQIASVYYGGDRFKKFYLDFINVLYALADSAMMKVLVYFIMRLGQNKSIVCASPEKIAKDTKVGRTSVYKALKELMRVNFIKRTQPGVWMINPSFVSDLNELARYRQAKIYNEIGTEEFEDG